MGRAGLGWALLESAGLDTAVCGLAVKAVARGGGVRRGLQPLRVCTTTAHYSCLGECGVGRGYRPVRIGRAVGLGYGVLAHRCSSRCTRCTRTRRGGNPFSKGGGSVTNWSLGSSLHEDRCCSLIIWVGRGNSALSVRVTTTLLASRELMDHTHTLLFFCFEY